jgi:hypothetical protein
VFRVSSTGALLRNSREMMHRPGPHFNGARETPLPIEFSRGRWQQRFACRHISPEADRQNQTDFAKTQSARRSSSARYAE